MAQIIINIKPNGQATVEADGIQGTACSLHTQPYVRALGIKDGELPKAEMFATQDQSVSQGA